MFYLVESVEKRLTKTNSTFLSISANDGTSRFSFMVWGTPSTLDPSSIVNTVCDTTLSENQYGFSTNWSQTSFTPLQDFLSLHPDSPLSRIRLQGHLSSQDLIDQLDSLLKDVYTSYQISPEWRAFLDSPELRTILNKYQDFPAGITAHHAWRNGLSTHVCEILQLFHSLLDTPLLSDHDNYRPFRPELVIAAILFHDYGKIHEYAPTETHFEITPIMPLVGHIYLGARILRTVLRRFSIPEREILLAEHCVLAHHGILEYGSPVPPAFFEAYLVHLLDLLSARRAMFDDSSHMGKHYFLGATIVDPDSFLKG